MEGRSAIITGPVQLEGAKVRASDLRAGAALVIAGLIAEGETEIQDIYHIERGYSSIIEKLKWLRCNIRRESLKEVEVELTNKFEITAIIFLIKYATMSTGRNIRSDFIYRETGGI